jgi:FG-GAP-like repeat/FG-GAP repeat
MSSIAVGDFNGDGNPDVAAAFVSNARGTGYSISVFLGNGDGTFRSAITFDSPLTAPTLTAADLDGKGSSDLIGAFENTVAVLVSKGDGTFQKPLLFDGGYAANSILAVDVNRDGKADVLIGDSDAITVLINKTPAK